MYGFCGFDESNGNYYVDTYNNWRYWGYDHDMHALRAGNVTGDQLTFHNKKLMMYICQSYFYEREEQAGMLGDKYICVDSTFNSRLKVWDSDVYKSEEPEDTEVFFLPRNNEEEERLIRMRASEHERSTARRRILLLHLKTIHT